MFFRHCRTALPVFLAQAEEIMAVANVIAAVNVLESFHRPRKRSANAVHTRALDVVL